MNKYIFSPIFALILGLANNLIVPFVGEVTFSSEYPLSRFC